MKVLGERIKQLRKERKLTQRELADKLGISHGSVALYETGDRKPDPEMINKIADFFDVTVDYLFGRTEHKREIVVDNIALPHRLKQLREQRKWTQSQLGEKLGVSSATINRYEKGIRHPDPEILMKLVDLFDVSMDWLYGRTDNPKETVIDNLAFHRSDDPMKDLPPEAWEELQNYLDYLAHKYKPKNKDNKKGQG